MRALITLTLDPARFDNNPEYAYQESRRRIPSFLSRLIYAGFIPREGRNRWKAERQANGWAHLHMLVELTAPLTPDQLGDLETFWPYGRLHVCLDPLEEQVGRFAVRR
jgi:hypothetical protein